MSPGHASEILDCLSKYPLEVLAWIAASALPVISLSVVITRYLNEREKAILLGQLRVQDATVDAVKAKYEALIAALPRQSSNSNRGLFVWLVTISVVIGVGGGGLATRLYDSKRLLTESAKLEDEKRTLANQLDTQRPVISILPDKTLRGIAKRSVMLPKTLDENLEVPVVLFDGAGNAYKFNSAQGKILHVKAELVNRPSKPNADKTKTDSGSPENN